MKSWIHEIAESYVGSRIAPRKDLKENYVSLTEEQRFGLLSENILAYLDEQLQNAYGIGIRDLNEEQLDEVLKGLKRVGKALVLGTALSGAALGGQGSANDFGAYTAGTGIVNSKGTVTSDGLNSRDLGAGGHRTVVNPEGNRINSDGQIIHEPGLNFNNVYKVGENGKGVSVRDSDEWRHTKALDDVSNSIRKFSKKRPKYVTGMDDGRAVSRKVD